MGALAWNRPVVREAPPWLGLPKDGPEVVPVLDCEDDEFWDDRSGTCKPICSPRSDFDPGTGRCKGDATNPTLTCQPGFRKVGTFCYQNCQPGQTQKSSGGCEGTPTGSDSGGTGSGGGATSKAGMGGVGIVLALGAAAAVVYFIVRGG